MCGRYTLTTTGQLSERFEVSNVPMELEPSYNVAPTHSMPVVMRSSPNRLAIMQWGLIPSWSKDRTIGAKMINARAETIAEKPAFRKPFRTQRCLIPASGFYEWKQTSKGKVPHYFRLKHDELFAFAGLYDRWYDEHGEAVFSYTVITTAPNELVADFHNRMPAILRREDEDVWLDTGIDDRARLESLLQPYPASEMEVYQVSTRVNSPYNNDTGLIERTA